MGSIANIKVEPMEVSWSGTDIGFTDGDIEVSIEEQSVDITAHQEGTNVLDAIRTGKSVEIAIPFKETTVSQITTLLTAGGGTASAAAEVTSVTCVADVAGSLDGTYFTLNAADDSTQYYVWIDVDAGGNDPAPAGLTGIQVSVTSNDSAVDVGTAVASAVNGEADFSASSSLGVVTITNAANGPTTDAADVDTGFTVSVSTQGSNAVSGWGKSKDFTGMLSDSEKLILHPVVLDASDKSRNYTFWKAYPMIDSISFSGENPHLVSVTFRVFPDSSQADETRLFAYGDAF